MSNQSSRDWVGESFEFTTTPAAKTSNPTMEAVYQEYEIDEEEKVFLEDAQEAISKLYYKTSKRGKQMRGVRRKDAWQ